MNPELERIVAGMRADATALRLRSITDPKQADLQKAIRLVLEARADALAEWAERIESGNY